MGGAGGLQCFVYLPADYAGVGPPASCINIIEHFRDQGIATRLFVWSTLVEIPATIEVVTGDVGRPSRLITAAGRVPRYGYRLIQRRDRQRRQRMRERFLDAIATASPETTILYIWPEADAELVAHARKLGFIVIREMINCPRDTAKPLIDGAYRRNGLVNNYPITREQVLSERIELPLYDYFFAPSPEVEAGLRRLGIVEAAILPTSFGWRPDRFAGDGRLALPGDDAGDGYLRVAFVGSHAGRKGLAELLFAWELARIEGVLVVGGFIEESLNEMVAAFSRSHDYLATGYYPNVGDLYRACDLFVLPTYEEGAPQVTYEAAGCGLPVVTTPMGAARLIEHERNGLIVPAGDTGALAAALRRLADDPALRRRLGETARADAASFEYRLIGETRAAQIRAVAGRAQPTKRAAR